MLKKLNNFRLLIRYLKDPTVPRWGKFLFFVPVLYFISPIDIFPDVFFPIGYLEDFGVLLVGWQMIVRELEKYRLRKEVANAEKKAKKDNVVHLNPDDYRVK
jgi:uncharacterized membrane protein YkvA (DUF1232 family)